MKKKFVNQNPRNIAGFKHVRIQMCKWYPHFCHTFTLSTSNPISALISSQVLSLSGSSFHMAEWGPLQSLSTQSSLWPQRQTSFLCSFYLLSTLAWKIPWMEEPGGLQSMGSLRVWHDWATSLSLFPFTHWRRTWQPTPVFLPGESQGRGSLAGCRLWGRRVGHDWRDSVAAAAAAAGSLPYNAGGRYSPYLNQEVTSVKIYRILNRTVNMSWQLF